MFAIHTPQTITLKRKVRAVPTREEYAEAGYDPAGYEQRFAGQEPSKQDAVEGAITFEHETEDVSKCRMVVAIEDRTYTFVFGTQGPMAETAYADDETRKADEEREKEREAVEQKRLEADRRHADEANAHELKTADDTTVKDVAWDAPHQPDPPLEEYIASAAYPQETGTPVKAAPLRGPFDPPPGAQAAYHPGEPPHG